MKHVELPSFAGDDAHGWFVLAEKYFLSGGYDERRETEDCSVSLAGDVLSWFNNETHEQFCELEQSQRKVVSKI